GWGPGSQALWYTLDTSPFPVGGDHITHIAPAGVVKFVGNSVAGDGSPRSPYRTIEQALLGATNGTTLIFKADSTNTFSARPLVINRRLTLKGQNAAITGW
ncbi:MAG: hypothetical protein NTW03_03790, partial [Verrucomicrobia bacterium]|nr:hypothetical protein [Verrucomicrobiota bacterium]